MKILSENKALRRRSFLRMNILIALFVFIASAFMVVTGEYSSLQERQSADQLYNILMIGSIVYMAAVWVSCVMTKPFWFPNNTSD